MAIQQDDALLETLRLIGDLGEALQTQVRRLERLSGSLPGGTPSTMIDGLTADAERLKSRCEELRRRLGDSTPADVVEVRAPAATDDGERAGETPTQTADAVPHACHPDAHGGAGRATRSRSTWRSPSAAMTGRGWQTRSSSLRAGRTAGLTAVTRRR